MKQLIDELTETIEFRNQFVTSLQDFEDRFTRLYNHVHQAEKTHALNFNAARSKIKLIDQKFNGVVKSFDSIGDIYERTEILAAQLMKFDKNGLPPTVVNELSENGKAIMNAKPSIEKQLAELLSALADAERELYQPKKQLLRR